MIKKTFYVAVLMILCANRIHADTAQEIFQTISIMQKTAPSGEMITEFHNYSLAPPHSLNQDDRINKYLKEYEESIRLNNFKSGAHDDPGESESVVEGEIQAKVATKKQELLEQYTHQDDMKFKGKTVFKDENVRVDHYSSKKDGSGYEQESDFTYLDYKDIRATFDHPAKMVNLDSAEHSVMSKSNTIREYAYWAIDKVRDAQDIKIEETNGAYILRVNNGKYTLDKTKSYVVVRYEHYGTDLKLDLVVEASDWVASKNGFWYPKSLRRTNYDNAGDAPYPVFISEMKVIEFNEDVVVADSSFSIPAGYKIRDARTRNPNLGMKPVADSVLNDTKNVLRKNTSVPLDANISGENSININNSNHDKNKNKADVVDNAIDQNNISQWKKLSTPKLWAYTVIVVLLAGIMLIAYKKNINLRKYFAK